MIYCHLKPEKLLELHYMANKIKGSWLGCDWEILKNEINADGSNHLLIKVSNEYDWDIATINRKRQTGTLERIAQLCVASFTLLQIQKKYRLKSV